MESFAGLGITEGEAMGSVGISSGDRVEMLVRRFGGMADIIEPICREGETAVERQLIEGEEPLTIKMRGIEILEFASHGDVGVDLETRIEDRYSRADKTAMPFYDCEVDSLVHEHHVY